MFVAFFEFRNRDRRSVLLASYTNKGLIFWIFVLKYFISNIKRVELDNRFLLCGIRLVLKFKLEKFKGGDEFIVLIFIMTIQNSKIKFKSMLFFELFLNDWFLIGLTIKIKKLDICGVSLYLVFNCDLPTL